MNRCNLEGKVAIVTGANGGIGNKLVKELKKEGCQVYTVDKNGSVDYQIDFNDISDIENVLVAIAMDVSDIDYVFNVAGIGIYGSIDEVDDYDFMCSLKINVLAPFLFIKRLVHQMTKNSMILNIGSAMGANAVGGRSVYCTSKFALRGMSLSLADEIKGVDICLLTLGSVMDNFGTGGIRKRKELERKGKKYLKVEDVVKKIMTITKSSIRQKEYEYYPLIKKQKYE